MCIKCKNREMMNDVIGQVFDTTDALIDAFKLLERIFKQLPQASVLDERERKVYENLSHFVKGEAVAKPSVDRGALVAALQQAFPGAQVIVGSPDEIGAMLEKESDEANGKKTN